MNIEKGGLTFPELMALEPGDQIIRIGYSPPSSHLVLGTIFTCNERKPVSSTSKRFDFVSLLDGSKRTVSISDEFYYNYAIYQQESPDEKFIQELFL